MLGLAIIIRSIPHCDWRAEALARFDSTVDDYTGTIIKRERISGSLGDESRMEFKIRARKKMVTKL